MLFDSSPSLPTFILASQSPQRRQALEALRLAFEVDASNLDESSIQHPDPLHRVELLARAKAEVVANRHSEAAVIAGDTFVVLNGQSLEKPADTEAAKVMLRQQAGQEAQVVCGAALISPNQPIWSVAVTAMVKFRSLSETEITNYVTTQPVTTWSGAFSVAYPAGAHLLDEVHGSYGAIVYGLPLTELCAELRHRGWY
jgi:septum formation protein